MIPHAMAAVSNTAPWALVGVSIPVLIWRAAAAPARSLRYRLARWKAGRRDRVAELADLSRDYAGKRYWHTGDGHWESVKDAIPGHAGELGPEIPQTSQRGEKRDDPC